MHGVPPSIDLARFHGAAMSQIAIGEFQIQFIFVDPELNLSVEGDWAIRNSTGAIVDRAVQNDQRESFKVHRLLGQRIASSEVDAPDSLTLRFDNGWSLTVFDSSREYESFSISPGDIYV